VQVDLDVSEVLKIKPLTVESAAVAVGRELDRLEPISTLAAGMGSESVRRRK
jgi:hypothetical protein